MALKNFKANSAGFQAIAVGPEIASALLAVATKGVEIAEGLSADFVKTGDYAASFRARNDTSQIRTRYGIHPVASGILENTSNHAAAVEFGNHDDHKAHHVISRTAEALRA